MATPFSAPTIALADLDVALAADGYAILRPDAVAALAGVAPGAFDALLPGWEDLATDGYLRDGGRYRKRRHSCFVHEQRSLRLVPHRRHWQPVDYNALHGGMDRWFEPIAPWTLAHPAWAPLLQGIAAACSRRMPAPCWHIEAHQFRIDTADGVGRPTPEGAHRDGVDFVAVLLVARHRIKGGETRIFRIDGPHGLRFTLDEPWSMMLLEDARIIHESTPIQPLDEAGGHRDTLVLTFRAAAFLGDDLPG